MPIHDEEENIDDLLDELAAVLLPNGPCEVLAVDDGSRDRSLARMREWKAAHDAGWLRIVKLAQNVGQSAAVMAGVECAAAPIVATIDGDMQNDPADIPAMIARPSAFTSPPPCRDRRCERCGSATGCARRSRPRSPGRG